MPGICVGRMEEQKIVGLQCNLEAKATGSSTLGGWVGSAGGGFGRGDMVSFDPHPQFHLENWNLGREVLTE